jgi:uncharacterized membrane protein
MSNLKSFHRLFFHAIAKIKDIFFVLLGWIVINAVAITYFEQIPFADALYFSFVTGLTIGYGDISAVTHAGRVFAILTGFVGILMTGLIAAVAVYALRETMKHPTDGQ